MSNYIIKSDKYNGAVDVTDMFISEPVICSGSNAKCNEYKDMKYIVYTTSGTAGSDVCEIKFTNLTPGKYSLVYFTCTEQIKSISWCKSVLQRNGQTIANITNKHIHFIDNVYSYIRLANGDVYNSYNKKYYMNITDEQSVYAYLSKFRNNFKTVITFVSTSQDDKFVLRFSESSNTRQKVIIANPSLYYII